MRNWTEKVRRLTTLVIRDETGRRESLTGTPGHPIWSEDREDWIATEDLREAETLRGEAGPLEVLAVHTVEQVSEVHNLEVHGEHVFQVGGLGLLVHSACGDTVITKVGQKAADWHGDFRAINNNAGDIIRISDDGLRKV